MQRAVFMLIAVQLVDAIGLGLLLPLLPFFVQNFGATAVEVTQLVALYALAGMLFSPVLGRLSDKLGRKPLLLGCTLGSFIAYLGYFVADTLLLIFAVRLFSGIMSAKSGVTTAWLLDLVCEQDRAKYLGLLGSMNGIGMLIGPILASTLFVGSGEIYQSVFIGGALLSLIATVGVYSMDASRAYPRASGHAEVVLDRNYADLLCLNFSVFLAFSVIFSTSVIYMQSQFHWDVREAGLAVGLMTGSVAITRAFIAHRVLAVLGVELGTWVAGFVMALCLALCTLTASTSLFLSLYCLCAAAYAISAIGVTLLLAGRLQPESRGLGMGRLGAASSAAIVLGAATHGYLFDSISPAAPFKLYGVLVAILVTGWYLRNYIHRNKTHEQT